MCNKVGFNFFIMKNYIVCILLVTTLCYGYSQNTNRFAWGANCSVDAFWGNNYKRIEVLGSSRYKTYSKYQLGFGLSTRYMMAKKFSLIGDLLFSQKLYPQIVTFRDGYSLKDSLGNIYGFREFFNEGSIKFQNIELDTRLQYEINNYILNIGFSNFYPIFSRVRAGIPNPERKSDLGYFPNDNFRLYQTLNIGLGKNILIKNKLLVLSLNFKYQLRRFDYDLLGKSNSFAIVIKYLN